MTKPTCTGTNKNGQPCSASPLKGQDRCRKHPDERNSCNANADIHERWDRDAFLHAFRETKMVTAASRLIGIAPSTAYRERQRDEDFALAWHDVEEEVTEALEAEAYRRAHDGVSRPMVSMGEVVAHEQVYSDGLLTFLLKGRRPDRYRDNVKVEHGGEITQRVRVDLSKLDPSQLEALEGIAQTLES